MNTKRKIISSLVAGALLAVSGAASAAPVLQWAWTGTAQQWKDNSFTAVPPLLYPIPVPPHDGIGAILDGPPAPTLGTTIPGAPTPAFPGGYPGDGDTWFKFDTNSISTNLLTNVTLKEEEVNGVDLYNVGLGWVAAQSTGSFGYWVTTIDPDGLNLAGLDTVVSDGTGYVTKQIFADKGGALLLTLTSVDGARVPPGGLAALPTLHSFYVLDTISNNPLTGAVSAVNDIHNEYSVPEPASLALFGIGFIATLATRRYVKKT